MNALLEQACQSTTEGDAARVLVEGGWPRDLAEQAAAIMFRKLGGDIVGDSSDVERIAARPNSEADAAELLARAGYPPDYAAKVAGITFGSLPGDLVTTHCR